MRFLMLLLLLNICNAQVVRTPWGNFDPNRYVGCSSNNCEMCRYIRSLKRVPTTSVVKKAAQENLPINMRDNTLDLLDLSYKDTLADIGCGDGTLLIYAVEKHGCNGIGIEIDANKVRTARENVKNAGLEEKIFILKMDAREFNPEEHGVNKAVAYLYTDLLDELSIPLRKLDRAVFPFHKANKLPISKHTFSQGSVFLFQRPSWSLVGDFPEEKSEDVLVQSGESEKVPSDVMVVAYTTSWCGPCISFKQNEASQIDQIKIVDVDRDNDGRVDRIHTSKRINSFPTIRIQKWDNIRGEWTIKRTFTGNVKARTILNAVKELNQ